MKKIKLFITDLDGTLLKQSQAQTNFVSNWDGNRVDEINTAAVGKLIENNIEFCIATGRMRNQCDVALENIRFIDKYFISQNGAYIQEPNNNFISKTIFSKKEAKEIFSWLLEHGFNAFISDFDSFYIDQNKLDHKSLASTVKYFKSSEDNIKYQEVDYNNLNTDNIEFSNLGLEVRQITIEQMEDLEQVMNEEISFADSFITSDNSIDIVAKGADKASAIIRLAKILNLDLDEIAFVGDSGNDRPALKLLKHSFVMDHARDNVKCYATHVVKSVAQAIEQVIEHNNKV